LNTEIDMEQSHNHSSHPSSTYSEPQMTSSHSSLPFLASMSEEELSKEMQIKLLKEKLFFVMNQLDEKDRQLDHYKQLVKTLKDVLSEVSANRGRLPSTSPPQSSSMTNVTQPSQSASKVRPPPGFESKKNSIKGRKTRSFHTFEGQDIVDPSEVDNWRRTTEEDDDGPFRRSSVEEITPVETPTTPNSNSNGSPNSKNNPAARIKKSVSQSALSSLGQPEIDDEEDEEPFPSKTQVSSPRSKPASPSSRETEAEKKVSKLKKSQSMTSVYTVLEENRLESKFPELDQLIGQIYPLSKYQQGCRFLQKKLDEKNPTNTNIILSELFDHLAELLTDPFGNYLFSKLMEHCDSSQREKIVKKIIPDIMSVAFDMYGTQSLQKMMPFLSEEQIDSVIEALKSSAIALIKHNKANYLIQYCLDHLPSKHNQWIYNAVCECMEEIARDRVGCVIVKRCIDHATPEQREKIIAEITKKVLALVQDPFGNYVVQHVLEKFPKSDAASAMIGNLLGSINELCVQKFSSNVVEKCLQVADERMRFALLKEIIASDMLPQLLNDRFANFVIQTALDVAIADQRQLLVKNILPHLGRHYSPYTKRLQKKILQMQQDLQTDTNINLKTLSESPK